MRPTNLGLGALMVITILVAGCAIPEISSKDAAAYQGGIKAYIEDRFLKKHRFRSWPEEDGLRSDGTIVYTGYFNNVNYSYLLRPREELQKYCVGKGGKFSYRHSDDYKRKHNAGLFRQGLWAAGRTGAFGEFFCRQDETLQWSAIVTLDRLGARSKTVTRAYLNLRVYKDGKSLF